MSPWERLLESPRGHFVQIYETGAASLNLSNVGIYLRAGLRRGDGALAVTSREQWESFCRELDRSGVDVQAALRSRQLVFCEDRETLARFMVGGEPHWRRFEEAIGAAMRTVQPANGNKGLRVYGDMVGFLWKARQFSAAIRLEQLWNKLLEQSSFSLYCRYGLDAFGEDFQAGDFEGILCTHTHLIPAQADGNLEASLKAAMEEILGPRASAARNGARADRQPSWAIMPNGEAILVWLRNNLPGQAAQIMARARYHYGLLSSEPQPN
ncbi:MAG: MEDS domain-containing protein [Bryobacteraceae bacterium]